MVKLYVVAFILLCIQGDGKFSFLWLMFCFLVFLLSLFDEGSFIIQIRFLKVSFQDCYPEFT